MKNKENKKKKDNDSDKQRNIILVIIATILLLLILLIGIKSCSSNEYKIDFIVNDEVYHTIETKGNEKIEFPEDPEEDGYEFNGWYLDDTFDTKFIDTYYSNIKLEKDIEVYAEFKIATYTITYYDEFNQSNDNKTSGTSKDKIELTDLNEYQDDYGYGYQFLGWYTDQEYTNNIDTLTNITSNINLYASYEKYSIGLLYTTIDNQYYVSGLGTVGHSEIYIPSKIDGLEVVGIAKTAFLNKSSLVNITIPDSVTFIGEAAFANCTALTSIVIPNSVTSIGDATFYNCTALTRVTLPNGLTSISDSMFDNCSALTSIEIPESVTSIDDGAFKWCASLTSIIIPSSVTSIGEDVFHNCTSLTSIEIPSSVTSIGDDTFHNCTSLTSVILPDTITSIGESAFYNCSALTSIEIPSTITSIGYNAFYDCNSLTITFDLTEDEVSSKVSLGSSWNSGVVDIIYKS
ncbi:MAG: leucine-rich repeat protein [bacterium]